MIQSSLKVLTLGLILRKSIVLALFLSQPYLEIGMLTSPHQIVYNFNLKNKITSFVTVSFTILFSEGVLPVFMPEEDDNAPVSVIVVL